MRRMIKAGKTAEPEAAFERVLIALERELIEATDEEIVEAARDLRMNLAMKGSAAFIGLKYPSKMAIRDFLLAFDDLQELQTARATPKLDPPDSSELEASPDGGKTDDE